MEPSKKPVPHWLQNLQENSWEIELLISGGAVFTLLQFPEAFLNFMRMAKTTSNIPGSNIILVMGMAGIKILTNGFILHLLLRSYWLAMVCLKYIFPQGIDPGKMKRALPFRPRHVEGDLQDQIMAVDRLSGLVIFMTIISTLVLGGLVVGLMVIIFLMEGLASTGIWMPVIDEFFGITSLCYFLDLIFMGLFRRIPVLSWVLFPAFRVYDIISFRFVYARPLALFTSNINKSIFFGGALIFILITGVSTYFPLVKVMHWPRLFDGRSYRDQLTPSDKALIHWNYADQMDAEHRGVVYIPSALIENNFLQVNLRYDRWMDGLIDHSHPERSKRFLSNLIALSIDDSLYSGVEWLETKEVGDGQLGLVALIDISGLPNGAHKVLIQSKDLPIPKYQKIRSELMYTATIPFWKDVH